MKNVRLLSFPVRTTICNQFAEQQAEDENGHYRGEHKRYGNPNKVTSNWKCVYSRWWLAGVCSLLDVLVSAALQRKKC